jgi:hypothetical protein
MQKASVKRPSRRKQQHGGFYGGDEDSSGPYSSPHKSKKPNEHPKEYLYQTIKETIKQREDQLRKLPKNSKEREALENELNAAKRRLKEMQDKYKFENLVGWESYIK